MDDKSKEPVASRDDENFYQPDSEIPDTQLAETNEQAENLPTDTISPSSEMEWDAAEFIHKPKGSGWIVGIVIVAILLVAFAVWLQAWTFAVLIIVMAITFGVIAFRQPKILHYKLNSQGISVGDKFYPFAGFRAYGMLSDIDGQLYTIMLIPLRRMMPSISVFFTEDQGEGIVDIIGAHLPSEHIQEDAVERLMKYLHF